MQEDNSSLSVDAKPRRIFSQSWIRMFLVVVFRQRCDLNESITQGWQRHIVEKIRATISGKPKGCPGQYVYIFLTIELH